MLLQLCLTLVEQVVDLFRRFLHASLYPFTDPTIQAIRKCLIFIETLVSVLLQ